MNLDNVRLLRHDADQAHYRLRFRDPANAELTPVLDIDHAAKLPFERYPMFRKIPQYRGSKHTPDSYWSATTGLLIDFESYLESQWMMMLDFDPEVTAFSSQPFQLEGVDVDGMFVHVPDIFARHRDGSALVLDIKNPRHIGDHKVRQQAQRTQAACDRIGWRYQMAAAPAEQRLENISWLAGFRRPLHAGAHLAEPLLALAQRPVTFTDLLSFQPNPQLAKPVIFHLLWSGQLLCDLDAPLRENSMIWAAAFPEGNR